jgi:hypothetical protein
MRLTVFFSSLLALIPTLGPPGSASSEPSQATTPKADASVVNLQKDFDVVIAGGTTAAFAAAIASAESGARTALIEPTDWIGGQLTASAVPAVDEAWHKITDPKTKQVYNVSSIARSRPNMTPNFRAMLDATGNPGGGWVSNYCFQPKNFLEDHLLPLEEKHKDKLVVFRDTVIKSVATDPATGLIKSLTAIHRTPKPGVGWKGYDKALSEDLVDWYSPKDSARFKKEVLTFEGETKPGHTTIFMDATEWGEVLALADAPYLQGVETNDGGRDGNDTCGQATVFDIAERLNAEPVEEPPGPTGVKNLGFGNYKRFGDAWDRIWTYRRIKGRGGKPAVGDICLQNWGYSGRDNEGGNDYPFGYLFKSKVDTFKERADWHGGVDLGVLTAAEQRALAWHYWFKAHVPAPFVPDQVTLDKGVLGTGTGLAKMPYIRDTRRSIGIDGFILKIDDISGEAAQLTGKRFKDRVALGAYSADIHPVVNCDYPKYVFSGHETLPFCLPFRSLTNEKYGNLLVAGKTMAQSFLTNSATRLHPIEWSTGTAAGVSAASMSQHGWNSHQAFEHIADLQALIKEKTPIDWTIDEVTYPKPGEETSY